MLDWARTAKTERERAIFLQMAEAWLDVARRREVNEATDERLDRQNDESD
jgi:hypothetical protein